MELFLCLFDAGDILEGHGRLITGEHPGPALAEGDGLVVRALSLAEHEQDQGGDHDDRKGIADQRDHHAPVARLLDLPLDAGWRQLLGRDAQSDQLFDGGPTRFLAGDGDMVLAVPELDPQDVFVDGDSSYVAVLYCFGDLIQVKVHRLRSARIALQDEHGNDGNESEQEEQVAATC